MPSPHLSSEELCFFSLRAEYLHKLSGIRQHGGFVSSPSFNYLFNKLYQCELMGICFTPWVTVLVYFLNQVIPAGHWELFQLAPLSLRCVPINTSLGTSLSSGTTHAPAPLPAPVLESATSPQSPATFCWRRVSETKMRVLDVFSAPGCHCFRLSQMTEQGNVCIH